MGPILGNNILHSVVECDRHGLPRFRPVTLLEIMKPLHYGNVADVHKILGILAQWPDQDELTMQARKQATDFLAVHGLAAFCEEFGLRASKASLDKLAALLGDMKADASLVREYADQLNGRLIDELQLTTLLALTLEEASRYGDAQPFGQGVAEAFPSCISDAEEATKCLALGRYTATVFHLMRVMEVGLRVLGARLNIPAANKPSWDSILNKAHGLMSLRNDKKPADWQHDEAFLSDAITMLTAVKTAWRNPTMHLEKTYTEEHAGDIWNAVRSFMQRLAAQLHE